MTTFLLVHGAFHSGWCWHPLVQELAARGHRCVAPDLPCEDPAAGLVAYTDAAVAALDAAGVAADDDDLVVVGHSLGGFTAPLVAGRRAVRGLVLLCTAPIVDASTGEELRSRMVTAEYLGAPRFTDPAGRQLFAPADARRLFYHDVPDALAEQAVSHLRPQAPTPLLEPWGLDAWPDVDRLVVLARDDRAVRLDAAVEAARTIIDVDPVVLDGGHSPFLARPQALAGVLDAWARGRPGATATG